MVNGSTTATGTPGRGRPIEPGLTRAPGVLPMAAVISVWPNPSRIVIPHAFSTWAMTSGLRGSPAPMTSRSEPGPPDRSALMSIRHTVGGAHSEVTSWVRSTRSRAAGSNRE